MGTNPSIPPNSVSQETLFERIAEEQHIKNWCLINFKYNQKSPALLGKDWDFLYL
jgi:hypothetical protein